MKRHLTVRLGLVILAAAVMPPIAGRMGLMGDYPSLVAGAAICYAAAALSLNLLMGYAGQISLGHFTLLGVGAFASAILTAAERLGLPFMIAVPTCALVGASIAFVVGLPSLRLRGLYLAVATIAFAFAMENSVFGYNWISRGSAGAKLPRPIIDTFHFTRNADYLAILLLLFIGLWLLDTNVTTSKLGRAFRGIKADEGVAASFGVDVSRYKLLAFVLSGAFAGVAGSMYGHLYGFVNAESFGYDKSLLLVIIVVIGGLGSRVGVTISALFYAVYPIVVIEAFGPGFRGFDLIVGALLLMFTIARHPGGIAQALRESREKKAAKLRVAEVVDEEDTSIPPLPALPRPSGLAERQAEEPGTPLLSASGITVRFGGLVAVDDASIDVHRGRIVGLIGPNGAGKTTMFNAIAGALTPDAGHVSFLGSDISSASAHARARAGIGRTFQLIGLAKDLSVTENLLLAQHSVAAYPISSALTRIGPAVKIERELRARAEDAIEGLGFERYADTPVRMLSHGQQRIVEIACALVTAPEIVMLDEPSAGMSPGAAENLAVRLRDLRDELGRTVLLIEHNIPLVLDVCDELYVMAEGRILAHGAPAEIVGRDEVVGVYLGETVAV